MQDIQNIPNPDVNSPDAGDDFNSHPRNEDVERPDEDIPVPPDQQRGTVPVEEPPSERDKPAIDEDQTEPKRIA